jgi:amino acid transporter
VWSGIKKILIGKPLVSEAIAGEKLNTPSALAVLSSDSISSVAYASEEVLWVLIPVIGAAAYRFMFYDALAVLVLLALMVVSYRLIIKNYPHGGGAYTVSRENLGETAGLVAGAALCFEYIMTVAVSASAGTAAITSAFPALYPHRLTLCLFFVMLLAIGNLRGVSQSAKLFGIPPYLFIGVMFALIVVGIAKVKLFGYVPEPVSTEVSSTLGTLTIFLVLRSFSAGCVALTGVEAVSNGIPTIKAPSQKNAIRVLIMLAIIIVIIFGGTSYLATLYHTVPNLQETVVSQLAAQVFGHGFMYYAVQVMTCLILILAANTSYSGFPVLAAAISRDGYYPRQFQQRGHRLNFNYGIIFLSTMALILIIVFRGETHYLIPLYAVGVFVSFSLAQLGMFRKWLREKPPGWVLKAVITGIGSVITFAAATILGVTKFTHGAWIVYSLIPIIVIVMKRVHTHYQKVAEQLRVGEGSVPDVIPDPSNVRHIIILVESYNKAIIKTINYAKCLSNDIVCFHVSANEETTARLVQKWQENKVQLPLVIKKSPYRDIISLLVDYVESDEHASKEGDVVTVVMSEFVVSKWWERFLHNQTATIIRSALLKHRNIAVISVPYIIEDDMSIYSRLHQYKEAKSNSRGKRK